MIALPARWYQHCLLCIAFFFILATSLHAQSVSVDNVPSHAYEGVQHIDGKRYYLFNPIVGSFTDRTLVQISPDMKVLNSQRLTFGRLVGMEAAATNGKNFLYYISSDKTGHLYLYDEAGQEIQHKEITAANNFLNKATLHPWGDKGYYIVRPDKTKKKGFRVSLVDNNLETLWESVYIPEKGKYNLELSSASTTRVNVLYTVSKETYVVSLNATDGSEAFNNMVDHDKMKLYPENMAMGEDNVVAIRGKYSPEAVVKDADERFNYYFQVLGADGSEKGFEAAVWGEDRLKSMKSNSTIKAYSDGATPELYIHSMEATGDGFRILAETMKHVTADKEDYPLVGGGPKVAGSDMPNIYAKPGFFFAMDLVEFIYSKDGKLMKTKKIAKPVKRTETFGNVNSGSLRTNAATLAKFGRLAYRFTTQSADGQPLFVTLSHNQNQLYTGFLRPSDERDNVFTRDYLEELMNPENNGKGENTSARFKKESLGTETLKTNGQLNHVDVLPGTDGTYVLTKFDNNTVTLEKRKLEPTQDPKRLKGVFTRMFKTGATPAGGAYSLYFTESGENGNLNYVLHFTNSNQEFTHSHLLEVPEHAGLNGVYSNNKGMVIAFYDDKDDSFHFHGFDANGKAVAQQKFAAKLPEGANLTNVPQIESAPDGFYVLSLGLQPQSKITGYAVTKLNNDLTEAWQTDHIGKKGETLSAELRKANSAGVLIDRRINWRNELNEGVVQRDLMLYSPTGTVVSEHNLPADQLPIYNAQMAGPSTGSSMYTAGIKIEEGKPYSVVTGLFVDVIQAGSGGEPKTFLSWEEIAGRISSENWLSKFQSGELRFRFYDLIPHPQGFALVTEIIQYTEVYKNGKYRSTGGTLTDFALIVFDGNAQLQDMYLVPRVPLNTTGIQASHLFSYHTTMGTGADQEFFYTGVGDDLEPYTYSTPVANQTNRTYKVAHARLKAAPKPEVVEEDNSPMWVKKMTFKLEKFSDGMEKVFGEAPPPPAYRHDGNTDQVFGTDGSLYVYRIERETNTLHWVKREFK